MVMMMIWQSYERQIVQGAGSKWELWEHRLDLLLLLRLTLVGLLLPLLAQSSKSGASKVSVLIVSFIV